MRKLFWTLSGLTVPAALMILSRGGVEANPPSDGTLQPLAAAQERPAAPARVLPPRSPFAVTAKSGAWMICAAHYTGPHAAHLADQVLRQLRERRINCYIFNYADEHRRKENEENMRRLHASPDGFRPRFTRVDDQCAVLIGGFKDMESASKALPTVKKLTPPKVYFPNKEPACDRLVQYGEKDEETSPVNAPFQQPRRKVMSLQDVNPFERSFVIRNPLAPHQQVEQSKLVDPFWKKLNHKEPYNLLECKKNYTLLVKCYRGGSEVVSDKKVNNGKPGMLNWLGIGRSETDVMYGVGLQANAMAEFLRKLQFEAYVLHTRQGSLVTIGGYNSLNDENLKQMQQRLGSMKLMSPQGTTAGTAPGEALWDLMPNPMPMPIPKL